MVPFVYGNNIDWGNDPFMPMHSSTQKHISEDSNGFLPVYFRAICLYLIQWQMRFYKYMYSTFTALRGKK